jgi:chromosome segregation ATPase
MSSKITIGVLVLVIIGSWIYFNSSKVDIITTYDNKIAVIDSAKAKIQAEFIEVSAKADSLTNQNTSLEGDLLDKSNQIQKLKSNISTILRKQNATDVELAEAKTLIADLNGKVTNLFADLGKAQAENKDLTAKNEVLNTTNTTLNTNLTATQKEKERLQYWLTANGLSYGRTLDKNGNLTHKNKLPPDNIKCRRVEFKIVTTTDELINKQIQQLNK